MAIHLISMAGYVTAVLVFVRAELCAREASSFRDFRQMTYWTFLLRPFLTQANVCF